MASVGKAQYKWNIMLSQIKNLLHWYLGGTWSQVEHSFDLSRPFFVIFESLQIRTRISQPFQQGPKRTRLLAIQMLLNNLHNIIRYNVWFRVMAHRNGVVQCLLILILL